MVKQFEYLKQEDVDHFMDKGYVVVHDAFSKEKAAEWTKTVWIRLGFDPNDKSTWKTERSHMPSHRTEAVATFAPKAWAAMKDLLGGDERIHTNSAVWTDAFIVNLGADHLKGDDKVIQPKNLDNWHVDGDFFCHFLDSPEQALLVIPVFSPIKPRGGGTYISPDGINIIANYLAKHPEGGFPTGLSFTPSTATQTCDKVESDPGYFSTLKEIQNCREFVEIAGDIGDVVLMHPLMLHTASKNHTRVPRIITNPHVELNEPFNFNRENPDDFSLVEKKTLKAIGVERLDFKITAERKRVVPARVARFRKLLEEEKARLEALKAKGSGAMESAPQAIAVA